MQQRGNRKWERIQRKGVLNPASMNFSDTNICTYRKSRTERAATCSIYSERPSMIIILVLAMRGCNMQQHKLQEQRGHTSNQSILTLWFSVTNSRLSVRSTTNKQEHSQISSRTQGKEEKQSFTGQQSQCDNKEHQHKLDLIWMKKPTHAPLISKLSPCYSEQIHEHPDTERHGTVLLSLYR